MPTKSKSRTTTKRRTASPARPTGLVERLLPRLVPPTHPGEMLLEEFLKPLAISQSAFAIRLGVSFPRLNEIVRGKRSVTPDTALRLARVTGMSADFWLGLSSIGISGMRSGHARRARSRSCRRSRTQADGIDREAAL